MQCVLQYAESVGRGEWATRQAISYSCRYLQSAATQSVPQGHLQPFLFNILTHIALPLTFFSEALHREWVDDPMEVIRRNSSAVLMVNADDLYDPRDAAVNLIHDILKTRALQPTLLDPFMEAVIGICVTLRTAGAPPCVRPRPCMPMHASHCAPPVHPMHAPLPLGDAALVAVRARMRCAGAVVHTSQ
jgi:hypothetical protein